MPVSDIQRPDNRRAQILKRATTLFGEHGYERTSVRDIAAAVGMLPGSVYYHFPSKEALLAEVYAAAIDEALSTVQCAAAAHDDPWDKIEAAVIAHLTILLDGGSMAVVIAGGANRPAPDQKDLIAHRHRYETVFRELVSGLELPDDVTASSFRLALLGALNWSLTWYRRDGDTPQTIARNLFAVFRAGCRTTHARTTHARTEP